MAEKQSEEITEEERDLREKLLKKRKEFKRRRSSALEVGAESATESLRSYDLLETLKERRQLNLRKKLPPVDLPSIEREQDGSPNPPADGGPLTSTLVNEPTPTSRLRRLREQKARKTRFDDLVTSSLSPDHRESISGAPPPSLGVSVSDRWKKLSGKLNEVTQEIERERSFDFFMSSISPVHGGAPKGDNGEKKQQEIGQEERNGGVEGGEETDQLIEEEQTVMENVPQDFKLIQEYRSPRYTPYQERVERERKLYFIPSRKLAPLESKTPGGAQPEFLEDVGLYTGKRPEVSIGNLAAMENRLLKRPDKGEGWFGKDGLLKTVSLPTNKIITRPFVIAEDDHSQLVYCEAKTAASSRQVISKGAEYQLELFLGQVIFDHHPLYSVEHVLSRGLEKLCKRYHQIDRERLIEQCRHKLYALQHSVRNLRQILAESSKQQNLEQLQDQLKHYTLTIRMIRQQLKQAQSTEYKLIQAIIEKWKEIKRLREVQGYATTNLQLTLYKIETDAMTEQAQWERDIEAEIQERKEDYELSIVSEKETFAAELAEWETYERSREGSITQSAVVGTLPEGGTTSLDPANSNAPLPERPRPVAPPPFDEDKARQELVEYYRQNHWKPGDPKLVPQLLCNYPIATQEQVPRDEQSRRNNIESIKYKVKILYNGKEVCTTPDKCLDSNFTVLFDEHITVCIVEVPNSIELQLIDVSSSFSIILAQVYIPIPDTSITSSNAPHKEMYQFSFNRKVTYNHSGVGSGHVHRLLPQLGELITTGHVTVGICWGEGDGGRPLSPLDLEINKQKLNGTLANIGLSGINSSAFKLKKWIEEAHLDPNDPRNWDILETIQLIPSAEVEPKYFRLIKLDEDAKFVEEEEMMNNKRFNLLKMRHQGHPALKGQSIPMNEDSITDNYYKSVCDYKPYSLAALPVSIFGNFYKDRTEMRLKYLNDVREKVLKRSGSHQTTELTLEDIVHEEFIPNISTLGATLAKLFAPRRPLKPQRVIRRKPKPQNVHVTSCHVTVRIVSAINVPVRDDSERLVNSFVRVQFGKEVVQTSTTHGPNPHWNEELVLPFCPPDNDFTPAALQKITHELEFHLYDEVVTDLLNVTERNTVYKRIERKWLGSYSIPFSTLHSQSRIEGTFQLDTPPITLGYRRPPATSSDVQKTYMQLFISLEPPLSILPPITDKFDSVEDSVLLEKGSTWLKSLRDKFPNRNYSVTALDINGRNVFLTRFIRPQNPPQSLLPANYETLQQEPLLHCMEQLAWYVSLIPFLPDAILFSGTCDIWMTSDLFLQMLGGDEEEHAVLLCNYFLFLKQKSWVVLGNAIPEGPTAYVLTYHPVYSKSYILWNPSTGKHFVNTLSQIPLTSIGCVFDNKNIWGNVQEFDHPNRVSFDFESTKNWKQLFPSSSMEVPLESIQVEVLQYPNTDGDQVQHLQTKIDQLVHNHIEQLRVRHLTRWNRHCCRILQNVLPRLEDSPFSVQTIVEEHKKELREVFFGYKITGYPLHIKYTDTTRLMKTIESTGIHLCEHEKVEFALSVSIHSYPNDILSVWIYLANLIPS